MKRNIIDKHKHIEPGKQVKIILARCKQVSEKHGYVTLGSVYTITDRPSRNSRKNGEYGVWVDGEVNPTYLWFHEWKPFVGKTVYRRQIQPSIKMVRTVQTVFKRTKF